MILKIILNTQLLYRLKFNNQSQKSNKSSIKSSEKNIAHILWFFFANWGLNTRLLLSGAIYYENPTDKSDKMRKIYNKISSKSYKSS